MNANTPETRLLNFVYGDPEETAVMPAAEVRAELEREGMDVAALETRLNRRLAEIRAGKEHEHAK